ncbi:MAG: ATP-grasp domain-containing protein [Myxococcales bacterium]|nr:ATP-grasp domain-containing protein [Myxococcales bacterium]
MKRLRGKRIDRIESLWEPTVLLAARVRELLGVPGMSRDTVLGFRDKQLMKERVARAGVRVPLSRRVTTADEARDAASEIGFPVIIKPIAGAGSADTFRCDCRADLESALARMAHIGDASLEEFIEGEEFTWDAISVQGRPVFESATQYHPRPLIARSEQWVSPAQLTFRDPHHPALAGGAALGRKVLAALGMGTGFTHMEWYKKQNGEVVFGEIAARSGGGHLIDMMNWANDIDVYREWARAVCWGRFEATAAHRYHVAMVFKRAQGEGRIARIEGLGALKAACGPAWVGDHLLPIGTRRRNWKQTVVSDGGVALRHPDYATCRALMDMAIRDLTLYAR